MYLVFTCMPGESYRRRLRSLLCDFFQVLVNSLPGSRDSSMVGVSETPDQKVQVQVPDGAVGNFHLQGQLSVLTFILVSVPPLCYCSSM